VSGVELSRVSVSYDGVLVLDEVALAVPSGGWVCLIGPNGAGKTTLLRSIAGLVAFSGVIRVADRPVSVLGRRDLSRLIAYVPQRSQVPESMTVTDYLLLGRTPYIHYLGMEGRRDRAVVAGVMNRLDLTDIADRPLGSLSGGELQRAILGRALAQQAPVLLLDEPTSALDVGHQQQVLEMVDALRREQGLTVVSAMHDLTLAGQFADRLTLLAGGVAVASGTARAVLTEGAIRRYYGAAVRILHGPEGGVLVIPIRSETEAAEAVPATGHERHR
jgi:iron complex transport system ATP-binding protein